MIRHDRSGEHYARVERERIAGESFLDALHRIAVEDAIAATGNQKAAAELLGTTPATVSREVHRAREKRVNVRFGTPELNRHGLCGKPAARPAIVRLPPAAARGAIL